MRGPYYAKWGKNISDRGNSMCKGSEAAKGLACLRNREEASKAGALRRVRKKQLALTSCKEPPCKAFRQCQRYGFYSKF